MINVIIESELYPAQEKLGNKKFNTGLFYNCCPILGVFKYYYLYNPKLQGIHEKYKRPNVNTKRGFFLLEI